MGRCIGYLHAEADPLSNISVINCLIGFSATRNDEIKLYI